MPNLPYNLYGFKPSVSPRKGDDSLVLGVVGGKILQANPADKSSILWPDGTPLLPYRESEVYLGALNDVDCFAWLLAPSVLEQPNMAAIGLRGLLFGGSEQLFSLAGRAVQLLDWQDNHRYCGRCGSQTNGVSSDISKICSACQLQFYPRISPCIITVVVRDDHCLLARSPQWEPGWFSALAGFVEAGESAEQALHREVFEEVGLHICNERYIGSQAWPFPGQLMLGYLADYHSGQIKLCEEELAEADWWRFDQLPRVPSEETMSGRLIARFVREAQEVYQ